MAITKAEIIELAFTRDVSTEHILDTDISVAVDRYVTAYVDDVTDASSIYDDYVKPVIAFGVAVNIFNRLSAEITDRGVVAMVTDGATVLDADSKLRTLSEYKDTLNTLIKLMCEAAEDAGMTLVDDNLTFEPVGFTGTTKQGVL